MVFGRIWILRYYRRCVSDTPLIEVQLSLGNQRQKKDLSFIIYQDTMITSFSLAFIHPAAAIYHVRLFAGVASPQALAPRVSL